MSRPDESRDDFRKACRSLDRIGAALQVLAMIVVICGVIATANTGNASPLFTSLLAGVALYALGAVFDWLNRLGVFLIDADDRHGRK